MFNPKNQVNKIYGYARVSTTEQAENGISIETQQKLISEFVKTKYPNHPVDEWFIDAGESGTIPIELREGSSKMLQALDEHDVVVTTRVDRLGRSSTDLLNKIPLFEEAGVTLYVCEQFGEMPISYPKKEQKKGLDVKFDFEQITNQIVISVFAAVAEIEFENTKKKFAEGKMAWAEKGYHIGGGIPFGYRGEEEKLPYGGNRNKTRTKLVPIPEEMEILEAIYAMQERGYGAKKIHRQITSLYPHFNKSWSQVRKIMKRKFQGLPKKDLEAAA